MTKIYEATRDIFNALLDAYGIEYTCAPHFSGSGYQWHFSSYPNGDIICCNGSYHAIDGCVESYGFDWDDGGVTALLPEEMILYLIGQKTEPVSTYSFEDFIDSLQVLLS